MLKFEELSIEYEHKVREYQSLISDANELGSQNLFQRAQIAMQEAQKIYVQLRECLRGNSDSNTSSVS